MPKVIKKRISKKTEIETEEQVKERLENLKEKLAERQRNLIKYGTIILILIIAVAGFFIYSRINYQKARDLEYQAYRTLYGPILPGVNKHDNISKALELFKKSYDTKKSPSSLYYSAVCYYKLGKYEDSINALKDFISKYPDDSIYTPLAYQTLASVYISKADLSEAKKTLNTLYALKGNIFKDVALMQTAAILEKEGKYDEAKKQYEELVKKFPESPLKAEAEAKLSEKKEG